LSRGIAVQAAPGYLEGTNMKEKRRVVLPVRFAGSECDALRAIAEKQSGTQQISLAATIRDIVRDYIQYQQAQA
jgi:hypothetical protein